MANVLKSIPTKKNAFFYKGTPVTNLHDLYVLFANISDKEFTNAIDTTAYASWIEKSFQDKKLANNLLQVPDRESALFCIESRIKETKPVLTFKPKIEKERPKKTLTPRSATFLIKDMQRVYGNENNRNRRR